MWAIRTGNVKLVQVLLVKGVEVKGKDQKGKTALTYAKQAKKKDDEEMLLKAGAAPEKDQEPTKNPGGQGFNPGQRKKASASESKTGKKSQ